MPHDPIVLFFIFGLYAFIAWLIFYQIELRLRIIAGIKCRFGYHKRVHKKLGQVVKEYRCVHCGKAKDHPHLKILDGGKKDLGTKFKW